MRILFTAFFESKGSYRIGYNWPTRKDRISPMGLRVQNPLKLGPFRSTLGKPGAGLSTGVHGLRAGIDANGRRYTSVGVPGLSWRAYQMGSARQMNPIALLALAVVLALIYALALLNK